MPCYGVGWVSFKSLLIGSSQLVIRRLLLISGDVELNPGPVDHGQLIDFVLIIDSQLGIIYIRQIMC